VAKQGVTVVASYSFEGVSGKRYAYFLVSGEIQLLLEGAGNYIFASGNAVYPVPVLIGAAERVRSDVEGHGASGLWKVAEKVHGASLLYLHVDPKVDQKARNLEQRDLVFAYHPPLNASG
jgi:hypothetical protein